MLLALALFGLVQLATIWLERSRMGYYLRALRANHAAAASVGIDERRWKLLAFAASAAMAAVAGVLYAQYTLFVDPPSTIALGDLDRHRADRRRRRDRHAVGTRRPGRSCTWRWRRASR